MLYFDDKHLRKIKSSPREDDLVVAAGVGAPLATRERPLPLAESGLLLGLGADGVEGGHEVARTIGEIRAAGDRRLVQVHRVGVLEAGEARRQQVDHHEVVLQHHQHRVRVLVVYGHTDTHTHSGAGLSRGSSSGARSLPGGDALFSFRPSARGLTRLSGRWLRLFVGGIRGARVDTMFSARGY